MKSLTKLFLLFLIGVVGVSHNYAANTDSIVAIVNDDIITQSELDGSLAFMYLEMGKHLKGEELQKEFNTFKAEALLKMVEDKLILQEAKNQGLEAKEERIDAMLNEVKAQFYSQEEFNDFLFSSGLTLGEVKEKFGNDILIKAIIDKEVRSKIIVHPQEITDYYNSHREEFSKSQGLEVDFVFAPTEKKGEFLENLNKNNDFDSLAKEYLESKRRISVYPGEFRKDIEDMLFFLDVGAWTKPLEIDNNIYIFRLVARINGHTKELNEVQSYIYNRLMDEKIRQDLVMWVEKLKENSYIIIK